MFVLDTNVVSELMRDRPNSAVLHWLDDRLERDLFVTAVTQAEVLTGIAILPAGKRRQGLAAAADRAFRGIFRDRVLPFDRSAAQAYAGIAAERRRAGKEQVAQITVRDHVSSIRTARSALLAVG